MSSKGFNLLQGNEAPPDMWDKVYDWVTKVGRLIVILVEVIVIGAFMVRVVVDTQTKDLLEKESQLSLKLNALRQQEFNYVQKQQKFFTYKTVRNAANTFGDIAGEIEKARPSSLQDASIQIRGNQINYRGEAFTSEVQEFETKLKANTQYFSEVQVLEVEKTGQVAAGGRERSNFNIRIVVKKELTQQRQKIGA